MGLEQVGGAVPITEGTERRRATEEGIELLNYGIRGRRGKEWRALELHWDLKLGAWDFYSVLPVLTLAASSSSFARA